MLFVIPFEPARGSGNSAVAGSSRQGRKFINGLTKYLFRRNLFKKRCFARLYVFINRGKTKRDISEAETGAGRLVLMRLPLEKWQLEGFNKEVLEQFINEFATEYESAGVYLDTWMRSLIKLDRRDADPYYGRALIKELLPDILKEIRKKSGAEPGSLDVSILAGEDQDELLECIKLLEPDMKYITVVSDNREDTSSAIMEFSEETGLSIGIIGDPGAAVANSDITISFMDPTRVETARLRHGSIFINLSMEKALGLRGGGTVINGVTCMLPGSFFKSLSADLTTHFNQEEITCIILNDAAGKGCAVAGLYAELGCRIMGFTGRRGKTYLQLR
jgi:hypothetical protein